MFMSEHFIDQGNCLVIVGSNDSHVTCEVVLLSLPMQTYEINATPSDYESILHWVWSIEELKGRWYIQALVLRVIRTHFETYHPKVTPCSNQDRRSSHRRT